MTTPTTTGTRSRGPRRALLLGGGVLLLVLLLAAGVVVGVRVLGSGGLGGAALSPDRAALEERLSQLEDRDTEALLAAVDPGEEPRQRVLLETEEAHPTEALVEDVRIRERRDGSGTVVTYLLEVTQDGTEQLLPVVLHAPEEGTDWDVGRLGVGTLTAWVPDGAVALRINGVEFPIEDLGPGNRTRDLWVMPGRYTVEAVGPNGRSGAAESHVFGFDGEDITLTPRL